MKRRFGAPYLLHVPVCGLHLGRCPPQPALYPDPPLTVHPPSYWLRLFLSQTFSLINTPTFLKPIILHLPAYEDGTESSETSAYKIQSPENYPEESIQHIRNFPKNNAVLE